MDTIRENRKKLAIFDMDGTVVEFTLDFKAARAGIIEYFTSLGVPGDLMDPRALILQIVAAARVYLDAGHLGAGRWHAIQDKIKTIIVHHEQKASESTRPIAGIEAVLVDLDRAGISMAICTLNSSSTVSGVLQQFNLSTYFKVIAGRDSIPDNKFKPHPEHGLFITNALGVNPSDTVVIGDHPNDVEMAIAMGAAGIAITSKRHPASDFEHVHGITLINDDHYAMLGETIKRVLGMVQ